VLGRAPSHAEVLVVLPHDQLAAEAVIAEAGRAAAGRAAVFIYRGTRHPHENHELLEVNDPYLKDYAAHDAFARAELIARKEIPDRRYVYVPGSLPREMVGEVWRTIQPRETVIAAEDRDVLPPMPFTRARRHQTDGTAILHLFTGHVVKVPRRTASIPG
jgi:hypothetical protein